MNFFDNCKQCSIIVGNGSGVLFQPKDTNYSYVLTAKHNLKNERNIQFKFEKIYKHNSLDIAIIKIKKREFISPKIQITEPKDKEVYKLYGYSSKRRKKKIEIQSFDLTIRDIHNKYEIIVFNEDYDTEHADIDGCSGGGVFKEANQGFLLAGIECRMDKESKKEENNTRIRFVSIKAFDEIVEKYSDELVFLDNNLNINKRYNVAEEVIDLGNSNSIILKTVPIKMDNDKILNVSIYPVTFKEYNNFHKINCAYTEDEKSEYPVINISWDNANNYCVWLKEITKKDIRMLYADEWNYIVSNISKNKIDKYITYSCSNLQKINNIQNDILGLYNIIGNIKEWCWDGDIDIDKKHIKGIAFSDDLKKINKLLENKVVYKSTSKNNRGFRIVF